MSLKTARSFISDFFDYVAHKYPGISLGHAFRAKPLGTKPKTLRLVSLAQGQFN